jgi:GNAT superfamily N-acetyltransferase
LAASVGLEQVSIQGWQPALAADFKKLNVEWLDEYFRVEPIDETVLSDPAGQVIAGGGDILFALKDGRAIGTAALKPHGGGCLELTKMAVTRPYRGRGVGRRLVEAAIARFHELGGETLFLESHSSLLPALKLYESVGFRHAARPGGPSPYERADVYMVYDPA